MKLSVPLWPLLGALLLVVVLGVLTGHTALLLGGYVITSCGWTWAIGSGVRDYAKSHRD